jgi:hypothetical protein
VTHRYYALVSRDTEMSEEMFDALMGFEVEHLRARYATFTREEVIKFLEETTTPEILGAFKDYYLMWAPEASSLS